MTKPLVLDFAFNRAAAQRRRKAALALLGLLLGVQCGLGVWRYQAQQERHALAQNQQLQAQNAEFRASNAPLSAAQTQAATRAHAMLAQLAVPWEGLLSAIEAARTPAITIEAVQPQAQEGTLTISANAAQFDAVAGFIARLEQQEFLHNVALVSEAKSDNGAGQLRFTLTAGWGRTP